MANSKSAKKRIRQNSVRRLRNRYRLVTTRSFIKKLRHAESKEKASTLFPNVVSMIDKCVKSNIFHKNKASNLKGKLAKFVNGLS